MERSRADDWEGSARPGAGGIGAARSLSAGRVLVPRGVAGSAGLTTLTALILHLLARCIAGRSRLSFDRTPILHPLAGCVSCALWARQAVFVPIMRAAAAAIERAVFRIVCSPWNCAGSSSEKQGNVWSGAPSEAVSMTVRGGAGGNPLFHNVQLQRFEQGLGRCCRAQRFLDREDLSEHRNKIVLARIRFVSSPAEGVLRPCARPARMLASSTEKGLGLQSFLASAKAAGWVRP